MKKTTVFVLCVCVAIVLMAGFLAVNVWRNVFGMPTEKPDVNEIDADVLLQVKQTYVDRHKEGGWPDDMTTDDVRVLEYCGSYRGCIAMMLTDNESVYAQAICVANVAGVRIMYNDSNQIYVWKDGELYTLEEAYEERILKRSDIRKIRDAHYQY